MSARFGRPLNSWDDWTAAFCDAQAFEPLVRAIYERNGMPPPELQVLTPGTNAVFRAGDTVVKIFPPREAMPDGVPSPDYDVERVMLAHAQSLGIPTSTLRAQGTFADAYAFDYLITDWIGGREAGAALPGFSLRQKRAFARNMSAICATLHHPEPGLLPRVDIRARALDNFRLQLLPQHLREEMSARAAQVDWREEIVVHGDLTGENVIISAEGVPHVIDFADAQNAPACYELAPLVFELFQCDRELVKAFVGASDLSAFVGSLLDGLSLHAFGPNILRDWAARERIPLSEVPSLFTLGDRLVYLWG